MDDLEEEVCIFCFFLGYCTRKPGGFIPVAHCRTEGEIIIGYLQHQVKNNKRHLY